MNELDSSRLSLAKAVSDAESLVASKEAEVAALKEEARRLELCDPASEHERDLDGRAYALTLIKGTELCSRLYIGSVFKYTMVLDSPPFSKKMGTPSKF